jgi:hypothetical protein
MKRAIVFVMLSVFLVSVTSSTASAALMGTWVPSVSAVRGSELTETAVQQTFDTVAQLNADLLTFEGLLKAYSVSGGPNVEEQVFLASDDLSASLESFNAELTDVYQDLSEEQKSALKDVYSSLGSYIDNLAGEANQIFQDVKGRSLPQFEVEIDKTSEDIPLRTWGAAGGL